MFPRQTKQIRTMRLRLPKVRATRHTMLLQLGDDWRFTVDRSQSKVWLTPRGEWGIKVVCKESELETADGLGATFAPKLTIDGLHFDGGDWRELVGTEVYQHGAWRGDGEPEAAIHVVQEGEIFESKLRVLSVDGIELDVALEAVCDVFFDDKHDTNVPLSLHAKLPFDGLHFRFRAEGAESRDPESRARELLTQYMDPATFGRPRIEPLSQPGLFLAHFPPADEEEEVEDDEDDLEMTMSTELRVLHQSGRELLDGMIQLEWLELEGDLGVGLVLGFVKQLEEIPDRGTARAARIVEWLLEQPTVEDLHCTDDQLKELLDKWW